MQLNFSLRQITTALQKTGSEERTLSQLVGGSFTAADGDLIQTVGKVCAHLPHGLQHVLLMFGQPALHGYYIGRMRAEIVALLQFQVT